MRKLELTEWAAVGELIGTIAVVASLLFVVYSLNQNTNAIHGSTENVLFERHADLASQFISDPTMAAILVKRRSGGTLTEIEAVRWEKYELNLLDIWALAYIRYGRDLLSDDQWNAWDVYFTDLFSDGGEKISKQRWVELERGFDHDFWQHVNDALFAD